MTIGSWVVHLGHPSLYGMMRVVEPCTDGRLLCQIDVGTVGPPVCFAFDAHDIELAPELQLRDESK